MGLHRLSIVIPAYNEEKRISATLKEYSSFFSNISKKKKFSYEMLIVINNTKDNTEKIVKQYAKKNKNIRYLNLVRGGKGYAVLEGFKDALKRKNDLIGFVDADMATPPNAFYDLFRMIGNNDGVIANRYKKGARIKTSFKRRIVGRIFNFIIRSLLIVPFTDTQCGAKLFNRKAINLIISNPPVAQWAFDVEVLHTLIINGFRIIEVPTIWEDKAGTKINIAKNSFQMFSAIVRLRLLYSPFRKIVSLYDSLPKQLKMHDI